MVAGKRDEKFPARRYRVLHGAPPSQTPTANPTHPDGTILKDILSGLLDFAALANRQAVIYGAIRGYD
jgi:hypothetical protein